MSEDELTLETVPNDQTTPPKNPPKLPMLQQLRFLNAGFKIFESLPSSEPDSPNLLNEINLEIVTELVSDFSTVTLCLVHNFGEVVSDQLFVSHFDFSTLSQLCPLNLFTV